MATFPKLQRGQRVQRHGGEEAERDRHVVAFLAGGALVWARGLAPGNLPPSPVDPVLALAWLVGGTCALGTAILAKFHRLAAMVLLGGAGLMMVATFVWFSAPNLAIAQLTVEVVTTVLLLGLRWLPKRVLGTRAISDAPQVSLPAAAV